jgi:diadenosine tetraphosphate (Ap4A) HIT family hydrolase
MLKVLLENKGTATLEQIASYLLSYDQSQVEYYGLRTKAMVGKVLTSNGVVEPIKEGRKIVGYRLVSDSLTEAQRASLAHLCRDKIDDFIKGRGDAIWGHRRPDSGYVSGSIRYQVLKRAKYRCELCGAHEGQAAFHIDHIIPRSKGGTDALSNFQCLCITCNTNKRDTDNTDFRSVVESYNDRSDNCIFCNDCAGRVIAENELCFAIRDKFPVTELHTLIIPKRHVADYFDLYQPELNAIHQMLTEQRQAILDADATVLGFNVGANSGAVAGQTIFHAHIHLMPRREGHVVDPRGGVRGVIQSKQSY